MDINFDAIPAELKAVRQWVCWRYETRDGKPTKVPINAVSLQSAKSDDPATWASYGLVERRARRLGYGIGFMFSPPWVGVDLDKCVADGRISEPAREILELVPSYSEITPSSTGIHILARGTWGQGVKRPYKGLTIEVYQVGRFFTVTGHALNALPVADCTPGLADLYGLLCPPVATPTPIRPIAGPKLLADTDIIRIASRAANRGKFWILWAGENAGLASDSEGDLALCSILAFYTRDAAQLDRLFRRSRRMRDKWDSRRPKGTYGELTIRKALDLAGPQFGERAA